MDTTQAVLSTLNTDIPEIITSQIQSGKYNQTSIDFLLNKTKLEAITGIEPPELFKMVRWLILLERKERLHVIRTEDDKEQKSGFLIGFSEGNTSSITRPIRPLEFQIPLDVISFSYRLGIYQYLKFAINLLRKYFISLSKLEIEKEQDPETGEEWVVLNIIVEGEVMDFIKNYNKFTENLVTIIPWPERDKIRISYCII